TVVSGEQGDRRLLPAYRPFLFAGLSSLFVVRQRKEMTMDIQVNRAEAGEVEALRELYRHEAHCQIIHDSFLRRGLADPYLILADGRIAGYGAISNKYDKGRLMEFYTLPAFRPQALPLFRELLAASQATQIEAQTNMPWMLTLFYDCATDIAEE